MKKTLLIGFLIWSAVPSPSGGSSGFDDHLSAPDHGWQAFIGVFVFSALAAFAHMPSPLPRCSSAVLLSLASHRDGGLRLFCTSSASSFSDLLHRRASPVAVAHYERSGCCRLERQLPGGLSSSHWSWAPFSRRTRKLALSDLQLFARRSSRGDAPDVSGSAAPVTRGHL
jgi:hypothetical protein